MWPSSATIPRRHPDPGANRNPLAQRVGACHPRNSADEDAERALLLRPGLPRRLLDPVAAWYVGNIPLGAPAENAVGGRIAFKTGTSYGDAGLGQSGNCHCRCNSFVRLASGASGRSAADLVPIQWCHSG
jgi:hypothetical protein